MKKNIIFMIIAFLLSLQLVSAMGIRPAKTTVIFEETQQLEDSFWVVNNDLREMSLKIYLEGEIAEFVKLKTDSLNFREDDEAKEVMFEINLPETVPPGDSIANIVVEEKDKEGNEKDTVSSRIILKHKITIKGPYPEKYIEAKLNFQDQGKEIMMVSEVKNLGQKDIGKIQTKFYVNDKEQKERILETEETNLEKKETKLLTTKVERDLFEVGEFEVSAVTSYDDQKVEVIKNMRLGKPEIDITYFDKFFIANKINEYSLDLLNLWNKRIENIFVEVEIKKDQQTVNEFRTKSVDIEGEATKMIQDYFDANKMDQGRYSFEMIVNFWDNYRMEAKTFQAELLTKEEFNKINKNALTGRAIGSYSFTQNVLPWMIVGMLLAFISFYAVYRYKNREKYIGGDRGAF